MVGFAAVGSKAADMDLAEVGIEPEAWAAVELEDLASGQLQEQGILVDQDSNWFANRRLWSVAVPVGKLGPVPE